MDNIKAINLAGDISLETGLYTGTAQLLRGPDGWTVTIFKDGHEEAGAVVKQKKGETAFMLEIIGGRKEFIPSRQELFNKIRVYL